MRKKIGLTTFCLLLFVKTYSQEVIVDSLPKEPIANYPQLSIDTTKNYKVDKLNDSLYAVYYAPKWSECFTNIPGDFVEAGRMLTSKKAILPLSIVAGSTALLYIFDKPLLDGVQQLSDNIGLDRSRRYQPILQIGGADILEVPANLNTGLYFIGEGWPHMLIMGGIGVHGAITGNAKELRLLTQYIAGYIEMGVVIQLIKRTVGREAPFVATTDRGKFRPFPSFSSYQGNTSKYDAMPSGHMATMTFLVTLLADAYPEKRWITPVGYTLIGACCFSMMNNGVHWSSDYPIGWGVGYLFAKAAAKRGKILQGIVKPTSLLNKLEMGPAIYPDGNMGIRLSMRW